MKEKIISNVKLEDNSYFVGEFDRSAYTEVMMTSIYDMVFSVRVYNCLKRAKVDYAGDLLYMTKDDFNRVRNLGEKGRLEVVKKLKEMGLSNIIDFEEIRKTAE